MDRRFLSAPADRALSGDRAHSADPPAPGSRRPPDRLLPALRQTHVTAGRHCAEYRIPDREMDREASAGPMRHDDGIDFLLGKRFYGCSSNRRAAVYYCAELEPTDRHMHHQGRARSRGPGCGGFNPLAQGIRCSGCYGFGAAKPRILEAVCRPAEIFEGVLPVLWRERDTAIYRASERPFSLAHVLRPDELVHHTPVNGLDVSELRRFVAAIEEPAAPPAVLHWEGNNKAVIQARLQ